MNKVRKINTREIVGVEGEPNSLDNTENTRSSGKN
jgi:hypothetical protein